MTKGEYNFSSQVKFHPWIGKHYDCDSEHKVRLLVLGESHYRITDSDQKNFTRFVIGKYAKGGGRLAFFTKCSTVMLRLHKSDLINDRSSQAERWDHVAFYNYIQSSVTAPNKERLPPNKTQWEAAVKPFKEVLEELKPDAVWVLGVGLWNKIDHEKLRKEYPEIVFESTYDPSRLSYDKSISTVQGLIKEAQRRVHK